MGVTVLPEVLGETEGDGDVDSTAMDGSAHFSSDEVSPPPSATVCLMYRVVCVSSSCGRLAASV